MAAEWDLLQPLWLLATPLPVLLWLIIRAGRTGGHGIMPPGIHEPIQVRHPLARQIAQGRPARRQGHIYYYLYSIAGLLLLLALAQPVRYGTPVSAQAQPVDLTLVIDTSVSMVLKDYDVQGEPVDRMTMTRALLKRFAERFNGNRLGLVIIGDRPYPLLQPSGDKDLVQHLLSRLRVGMAGRQAAIGDALAVASEQVLKTAGTTDKVLVLITDAVQPSGSVSPQAAARLIARAGVTLHTIAIGAANQVSERDSFGKLIYEPADIKLLKELASITGGNSFHAVDADAMDRALKVIEERHTTRKVQAGPRLQQPLYIWPLAAAMLLLAAVNLLSGRARQ